MTCGIAPENISYKEGLELLLRYLDDYHTFFLSLHKTLQQDVIVHGDITGSISDYLKWIDLDASGVISLVEKFSLNKADVSSLIIDLNNSTRDALAALIKMWITVEPAALNENCADPITNDLTDAITRFYNTLMKLDKFFDVDSTDFCDPSCREVGGLQDNNGKIFKKICVDILSRTWTKSIQNCYVNGLIPLKIDSYEEENAFLLYMNTKSKLPAYTSFWVGARKNSDSKFWWLQNGQEVDFPLTWKSGFKLADSTSTCLAVANINGNYVFDANTPCIRRMATICEFPRKPQL